MKNKKGFTLIELLIVISIVGILAIAFVPNLLNAPARARDGQRISDISNIKNAFMDMDLRNKFPSDVDEATCIDANGLGLDEYKPSFGGKIPQDPSGHGKLDNCDNYAFYPDPAGDGKYKFALVAKMETWDSANIVCSKIGGDAPVDPAAIGAEVAPGDDKEPCYAILVQ